MKKIFILVSLVILSSCTGPINSWDYDVIISSEQISKINRCRFTTQGSQISAFSGEFICDCNKFKVGDTIHIVKFK